LQRWFTRTDHPRARDPYFLSVAGNIGSIFALLAYPALLEPSLRLAEQSSIWTGGYVVLVLLTTACFYLAYRQSNARRGPDTEPTAEASAPGAKPGWGQRLHWIALSFVPSSLLLGVTTFLTTDVAAVPLLWIVPLVIYLLSFVLVFARRALISHAFMLRMLPLWVLPLAWLIAFDTNLPVAVQAPFHLLAFFLAAMVCHGELAQRRPDGQYLTEFYLSMSVGGCPRRALQRVGGAPRIFDDPRVSPGARPRLRAPSRAADRVGHTAGPQTRLCASHRRRRVRPGDDVPDERLAFEGPLCARDGLHRAYHPVLQLLGPTAAVCADCRRAHGRRRHVCGRSGTCDASRAELLRRAPRVRVA
jgi:hypothetical protein